MTTQSMQALFDQYSDAIQKMEEIFDSHEFILQLARDNQNLYIKALYESNSKDNAPFRTVHSQLAKHLHNCSEVQYLKEKKDSADIFGNPGACAIWKKI